MTTPITELLGETMDGVTRHIRKHYIGNEAEVQRIKRAADRQELYEGGGDTLVTELIDKVFDDAKVKELRHRYVNAAGYNNVTKRIVNEIATLYSKAAKRSVGGKQNDQRYQSFLRASKHDQKMRRANRMANLHRQVLAGFRVWVDDIGDRRHAIHVVTPRSFYALRHPDDPTWAVGYIIDQMPMMAHGQMPEENAPRYLVWTNHERFKLTHGGKLISETYEEHGFERMPWLLLSIDEMEDSLLDNKEGRDVTAGHLSTWFQETMLVKESASQNKQTAFTGDLRTTPTGQSADSNFDLQLGDGVGVQTIDRGVDLAQYRDTSSHILEGVAANWGIPPSVLKHQGATSGFEIELRRIGIRERRVEQEPVFRTFEREFAEIQAMVLAKDDPDRAFTTDGWSINFAETETPVDPETKLRVDLKKRAAGLVNTVEMIMERDPDLSPGEAWIVLLENIAIETARNEHMRPLQQISGSMGASAPGAEQDTGTQPDTHTPPAVNGREEDTATTAQVGGN